MISNIAIFGIICLCIGAVAYVYYCVMRYSKTVKTGLAEIQDVLEDIDKCLDNIDKAYNNTVVSFEGKVSSIDAIISRISADIETLKEGYEYLKKEDEVNYWKLEKAEKALSETKKLSERLDLANELINNLSEKKKDVGNSKQSTSKYKKRKDKDGENL